MKMISLIAPYEVSEEPVLFLKPLHCAEFYDHTAHILQTWITKEMKIKIPTKRTCLVCRHNNIDNVARAVGFTWKILPVMELSKYSHKSHCSCR
jgi:hypothetical protein